MSSLSPFEDEVEQAHWSRASAGLRTFFTHAMSSPSESYQPTSNDGICQNDVGLWCHSLMSNQSFRLPCESIPATAFEREVGCRDRYAVLRGMHAARPGLPCRRSSLAPCSCQYNVALLHGGIATKIGSKRRLRLNSVEAFCDMCTGARRSCSGGCA